MPYQVDSSRHLQTPEDVNARPCSCGRIEHPVIVAFSGILQAAPVHPSPQALRRFGLRVPRAYFPERPWCPLFVSSRPRVADSLTWPAGEHPLEIRARSRRPTARRHLSPPWPRTARLARPDPADAGRSRGPPVPVASLPTRHVPTPAKFSDDSDSDGRVAAFRRARATPPAPAAAVSPRTGPGHNPIRRGEVKRGGTRARANKIGPAPPGRRRPWSPGLHVARSRRGGEGASHGRSSNPEPGGGESLAENRFAPAATTSCLVS
jgi:hypothetical protein